MKYKVIQPPFTLKFHEMAKGELREYGEWLHSVTEERLTQLEATVRQTQGFEQWRATYTENSLDLLGEWFVAQVSVRPRTKEELNELHSRSPMLLNVDEYELTNQTFSLAIDIGLYVARMFLNSFSHVRWTQSFKSKKDIDYGQPVLIGFGKPPFNPLRMMVTLAYSISRGTESKDGLRQIYMIWSKLAKNNHNYVRNS